jgi:hypothetical protein
MRVGHLLVLDHVRHEDVDDQDDHEDEGLHVKCFRAHLKTINHQS